jgi:carbonic anhydrase
LKDLNGRGPFTFKADHLHFHGPAEHTIEGVRHDIEIHIVNTLVDGPDWQEFKERLSVVAVVF